MSSTEDKTDPTVYQATIDAKADNQIPDDLQPGSLLAARQSGLSQSLPELDSEWWTKVVKHRTGRVKKVRISWSISIKNSGFFKLSACLTILICAVYSVQFRKLCKWIRYAISFHRFYKILVTSTDANCNAFFRANFETVLMLMQKLLLYSMLHCVTLLLWFHLRSL